MFVAAHPSEAAVVEKALTAAEARCEILTSGVGGPAMSWALQKRFTEKGIPGTIINVGIAGSYDKKIKIGEVVMPLSDCFADLGVDDNGSFVSLFKANLADPDKWPFSGGIIQYSSDWTKLLGHTYRTVRAATVNMTSGSAAVIERISREWNPDIETMEGAWFAYSCAVNRLQFFSLRAVSNRVEPRNVRNWDIPLALENLENALVQTLTVIKRSI